MADKKNKVYFVNPASEGNTVWAAPSPGHKDGKYVLKGCGQKALQFLYEEVNNRNDIHVTEMTAKEVKLMEKGEKRRAEMKEKSAKAIAEAEKKGAKVKKEEKKEEPEAEAEEAKE